MHDTYVCMYVSSSVSSSSWRGPIFSADSLKTFIGRTQERLCTNSLNVTNLKMLISNLKRRGFLEGQDGRQGWSVAGGCHGEARDKRRTGRRGFRVAPSGEGEGERERSGKGGWW